MVWYNIWQEKYVSKLPQGKPARDYTELILNIWKQALNH